MLAKQRKQSGKHIKSITQLTNYWLFPLLDACNGFWTVAPHQCR